MKNIYLLILISSVSTSSFAQALSTLGNREVVEQKCLIVTQPEATLELWDAGIEDNDTVTIFLNGKAILEKVRLSKAQKSYPIQLAPGQNQIIMFAENLGDIPDNTCALSINGSEKKSLSSGLKTCGSLAVHVTGGIPSMSKINCVDKVKEPEDEEAKQLKQNPQMANPSYSLLSQGIRKQANESFRTVDVQGCYNASNKTVKLLIWDCGVEDNDTISLSVNGQWILEDFRLSKQKQEVEVQLLDGENIIVMYANNLGDIPVNTAALGIDQIYTQHDIGMMVSDKNKSGAYKIFYGFEDEFGNDIQPCLKMNEIDSTTEAEVVFLNRQNLQNRQSNPVTQPINNPGTQNRPTHTPTQRSPNPVFIPAPRPTPKPVPKPTPSTKPAPTPQKPAPRNPTNTPPSRRNEPEKPRH